MWYQIAEHTADRLVVRRYWDGRGEGLHMLIGGIVYIVAGSLFSYHSAGIGVPGWGRILGFVGGIALGGFFIWLSRRQRKCIAEGLYIFDKRLGVFELSNRTERGTTKAETYPLDQVQEAIADDIGTEGYARRLVIVLRDKRSVTLHNWTTFIYGDAERASKTINEFLGIAPSQGSDQRMA